MSKTVDSKTGESREGHSQEYKSAPGAVIVEGPRKGQHESYWILSDEERAKGFVRPVRKTYLHTKCGTRTTMSTSIAETYARDPKFYGATFCVRCGVHYPVSEFTWEDGKGEVVGS